ncbi:hypothetical protein FC78_GL001189 [Companilactobacillus bobalius DSM 19674]|uniref:Uncharacterized protein n=2 Tax=Companilactobacillus bobalius TaxID=2801451 RepID=A0A0R1KWF9_9LACO|nr:hypothetical protein FC78_GL001189 [Companilactobacillus bobalius DSM 19674]
MQRGKLISMLSDKKFQYYDKSDFCTMIFKKSILDLNKYSRTYSSLTPLKRKIMVKNLKSMDNDTLDQLYVDCVNYLSNPFHTSNSISVSLIFAVIAIFVSITISTHEEILTIILMTLTFFMYTRFNHNRKVYSYELFIIGLLHSINHDRYPFP